MTDKQQQSHQYKTANRKKVLVVGMGKTGLSCVRFLLSEKQLQPVEVLVCDSRENPPELAAIQALLPWQSIQTGAFNATQFSVCRQLVVSPGVPLDDALIQAVIARGGEVVGDIELFVRHVSVPIIAITGSNGKSTVTALVTAMLKNAGLDVRIGANFGVPALDLLAAASPDVYVLELSSFQLESTYSLQAAVSVILNISPDHMDRYTSVTDYCAAKQRVWGGNGAVVINRDESGLLSDIDKSRDQVGFTLAEPAALDYGLRSKDKRSWLAYGEEYLLPVSALRLTGRHNCANALAALALTESFLKITGSKIKRTELLQTLTEFRGLPHRMEWLAESGGVNWINDSKGTNVGATIAGLKGLDVPVILILGGISKGGDFTTLIPVLADTCRAVVLIGRDAQSIEEQLDTIVPCWHAENMEQAVDIANTQAIAGDVVLLSPACASFDMFKGYEHRGQVFAAAVTRVLA